MKVERPFEENPVCPKCGTGSPRLGWDQSFDHDAPRHKFDEFLRCLCRKCEYIWEMACKDAQVRLAPERTPKLFLKVEKDSWPDAVLYEVGSFSMEPMYRTVFDGSGLIAVDREVLARIMTVRIVENLEPDSFPQPGEVVS